ncbi:MAG: hypothetical protein HONBIEJF_01506 [Fimbriimonadaceae bacterium]|nr:hypothetical protein [Fimbriimonadaceae bacterium]
MRAAEARHPPGWVYIKTTDGKGRILEEGWEYEKPPERFEKDGLSHIGPYIDQLLESTNWYSSVTATVIDGDACLLVSKMEGRIEMIEWFDANRKTSAEETARAVCSEQGFPVKQEYVNRDRQRCIIWNLPADRSVILSTLQRFAKEVHAIPASAGFELSFQEHADERKKHACQDGISFFFTYPVEDPNAPPPE